MRTKLTPQQIEQLDNLIAYTIIPALQEDVCIPDMSDYSKNNSDWDDVCGDRMEVLYGEALAYLKNNLL